MKQPVSLFIMDVTHSSSQGNWLEMTQYLQTWEQDIEHWFNGVFPAKVTHRRGDEILFVGTHYFSAYTVAHHISQHWKYSNQRPYFGISYGYIDEAIETVDIEIWNHPLIKRARQANEYIKNRKNRETEMHFSNHALDNEKHIIGTTDILNLLVNHQYTLFENQSVNQRLICALHSVFEEQKQVARALNKTQPTISTHYNKGDCALIYQTYHKIQKILSQDEINNSKSGTNMLLLMQELNASIRNNLQEKINELYPQLSIK